MKQIYEQPKLTVNKFSVENVLTLSRETEDTYFNLDWIAGVGDEE